MIDLLNYQTGRGGCRRSPDVPGRGRVAPGGRVCLEEGLLEHRQQAETLRQGVAQQRLGTRGHGADYLVLCAAEVVRERKVQDEDTEETPAAAEGERLIK